MTTILNACALLGAAAGHAAPAGVQDDSARIRAAVARGQVVQLPRILLIAQRHVRGEILKIELEEEGNALIYEVKVLTPNGRMRELRINARTGRLLGVGND